MNGAPHAVDGAVDVVVPEGVVLAGPVVGLEHAQILGPCVLGQAGASATDEPLVLGAGVIIRAFAVLYRGSVLGARTRIHSGGFLANTRLGDDVFCGPHVVFTDDPHPPCPSYATCVGGAV